MGSGAYQATIRRISPASGSAASRPSVTRQIRAIVRPLSPAAPRPGANLAVFEAWSAQTTLPQPDPGKAESRSVVSPRCGQREICLIARSHGLAGQRWGYS
jgi:hypothetical protein